MTPEQQNLWNNYKRKQAEFARASKEIRLQLKTELDALSNRVRMINILYVPLGIIIIGLCWAVIRRLQHGRRERS